ncbi:hypothetical protein AOLI_G00007040 [Acnodon oligacanthus]
MRRLQDAIRRFRTAILAEMADTKVDTSSEISAKDLKEKKLVEEEAENGKDAPANGNADNEENGDPENEVEEEEDDVGEEEDEEDDGEGDDDEEDDEAEGGTGKRAAEDDDDEDDVETKKQKTDD